MSHDIDPMAPGAGGQGTAPWRLVEWPTAVVLGLTALAVPGARVVADAAGVQLDPTLPVALTLAVSVVWIGVVTWRVRTPAVPTLVGAGLVQVVASSVLALVAALVLHGRPDGPLVQPFALVPAVAAGVLWGVVCGAVALALQRARSGYPMV